MGRPLPAERRARILEILQAKGTVSVAELAQHLGVSQMTIHRDLRQLQLQGAVHKVFGGAALFREAPGAIRCAVCGGPIEKRLDFIVELDSGERYTACCPHCGLMLLNRLGSRSGTAVTFDFLSRQTINARDATYLVGSRIAPCCSPSVLAFLKDDEAAKLQGAFGGERTDLRSALDWVNRMMTLRA